MSLTKDVTSKEASGPSPNAHCHYSFELERPATKPDLKRVLRQRVQDVVREVGDEYAALVSRCWCAPLSITVDGVDLETDIPHPAMRFLSDCKSVGCGVDRYHMGDHWLAYRPLHLAGVSDALTLPRGPCIDGEELTMARSVSPKECFLRWSKMESANAALLISFASLAHPGVDFLHDGALIAQYDFPYTRPLRPTDRLLPGYQRQAVGYRIFVGVDRERLDLSGFGVREVESLAASLYQQVRSPLLEMLYKLEGLMDNYRFTSWEEPGRGRFLNRLLAPLSGLNRGFTINEAKRTLAQLRNHVQKAPSARELF